MLSINSKTKGFLLGTPQKRRRDVDEDAIKIPLGMGYVTLFLFVCAFALSFFCFFVFLNLLNQAPII